MAKVDVISFAAQQGAVVHKFNQFGVTRAKSYAETKKLPTEFNSRLRMVQELTDKPVDPNHQRSVPMGMIDDETREHTASPKAAHLHNCWFI